MTVNIHFVCFKNSVLIEHQFADPNSLQQGTMSGWLSGLCVHLTQKVVGSCTGRVIPKTIIKMVQAASLHCTHALGLEFDSATRLSKRLGIVWKCLWGHALNPLTANPEISRRVIKTPRLPTTRYLVTFFMSQNCQRRDISPTLRQNGTRQHRSSKATGDCKCLTNHVTHSFLISIKINTLFFDIIIYFNVVNYE